MTNTRPYKLFIPVIACCALLSACGTTKTTAGLDAPSVAVQGAQPLEITGGIYNDEQRMPIISNDPSVAVYPLDGPVVNPLEEERYNSVLDNTTAGGYTVFDESVKVYPLPGDVVPSFVPAYAVPPLQNQFKDRIPHVGEPTSLAQSNLPPVPTVVIGDADPYAKPPVSGAMRKPMLTAVTDPVELQSPSDVRAPMLSSYADVPVTEYDDEFSYATDAPAPVTGSSMTPGRKSGPLLTGY